jgi:hypothetical protein
LGLGVGYWVVGVGWSLGFGHWVLGIRHWVLGKKDEKIILLFMFWLIKLKKHEL